jgi:hypothetical protein
MATARQELKVDVGDETADESEGEQAEVEQEGSDRASDEEQRGDDLQSLVSRLPPPSLGCFDGLIEADMPDAKAIADKMVTEFMRAEARLDAAREELARTDWDFTFEPDDYCSAQRARLVDFDEACGMLDALKTALLQWLRAVDFTCIVQLDAEAWAALRKLAKSTRSFQPVPLVVKAALLHLAGQADGARVVAEVEQRRLEALDREYSRVRGDNNRRGWPWTQLDGSPWPHNKAAMDSTPRNDEQVPDLADSGDDDNAEMDDEVSERRWPNAYSDTLRLQVWSEDERKDCMLNLAVVLPELNGREQRDAFLGEVTRLAARWNERYARQLARLASAAANESKANKSDSAEDVVASTEPPVQ